MRPRGFGDLESVVMNLLWDRQSDATVRDLYTELADQRQIAYTTVMSTMDNLYRKGWLTRKLVGKAYAYSPVLTREEYSANLMRQALQSGGNSDLVLNFFIEQMSDDESAQLRAALRRLIEGKDS